ncbi:MAG: ribosomal protein L13e [Thermoproteota archaeon]
MKEDKIIALVKRRRGLVQFWREARGFSIDELREVGLTVGKARKLGLRVDERRRSKHEKNLERLREFLKSIQLTT